MKKFFILLSFLVWNTFGQSHVITSSEVTVNPSVIPGQAIIYSYTGTATDIIIPDSLDGLRVRFLGGQAFRSKGLTSVVLPKDIDYIGMWCFSDNNLSEVILPDSLTHLYEEAFSKNAITSISIPNALKRVDKSAFSLNSIDSLYIPATLEFLGSGAFSSNNIKTVIYDENSPLTTVEASTFSGNVVESIVFPPNLDTIENYAFRGCNFKNISLPEGLIAIKPFAFKECSLTTITIPSSIESIGENAFELNQISSLNFTAPSSLKSIGEDAFTDNLLQEISIPSSVIEIDNWAFLRNDINKITWEEPTAITMLDTGVFSFNNLDTIRIPASVEKIMPSAFHDSPLDTVIFDCDTVLTFIGSKAFENSNIKGITIPSSVEILGSYAFSGLGLQNVTFSPTSNLSRIGSCAFRYNSLTSVILPNKIETIDSAAFAKNKITDLTLNEGLIKIGGECFLENEIDTLHIPSTVEVIGQESFELNMLDTVIIPDSSNLRYIMARAFYVGTLTAQKTEPLSQVILPKGTKNGDSLIRWSKGSSTLDSLKTTPEGNFIADEFDYSSKYYALFPLRFTEIDSQEVYHSQTYLKVDLRNYLSLNYIEDERDYDPEMSVGSKGSISSFEYSYRPDTDDLGTFTDTLTITAYGITDTGYLTVSVLNHFPVITNADEFPSDTMIYAGQTFRFSFESDDADGYFEDFYLAPGSSGEIQENGDYVFRTDSTYITKPESFEILLADYYDTTRQTFTFNTGVPIFEDSKNVKATVSELTVGPNPIPQNYDQPLVILIPEGLHGEWSFCLYDPLGNLVVEDGFIRKNDNQLFWDIHNDKDKVLALGAYLIVGRFVGVDGKKRVFKRTLGVEK